MNTQNTADRSKVHPDIQVTVPFKGSGDLTLKVYITGEFGELSDQAWNTITCAGTATLLQFPTMFYQDMTDHRQGDQSRVYGTDPAQDNRAAGTPIVGHTDTSNEYGGISAEVVLERSEVHVPERMIRALAARAATTVLDYATAAITDTPATEDPFKQIMRNVLKAETTRSEGSLVGAGSHSSR